MTAWGKGGIRLCPVLFFGSNRTGDIVGKCESGRRSGPHKRRLAAALRSLNIEVVNAEAPEEVFLEAAEAIEGFTKGLKEQPRRIRRVGHRAGKRDPSGSEFDYGMMDLSPLSGSANPLAPPMKIGNEEKDRAVGVVTFPAIYGLGPGSVHNGFLAATMDEVFGAVLARMGRPPMTGILDVRFRSPCPVEKEVRIEGWVRRESGQIVFTEASVTVEGRAVADGDAVFFIVGEEAYERLSQERNERIRIR
jgi:acyl-coenzyme A thioesterase PaaI-like protein